MQLHLDLVGGLAGDMFIAALLDAFPHHETGVLEAIAAFAAQESLACSTVDHLDGVFRGRRFVVQRRAQRSEQGRVHGAPALPAAAAMHSHTTWSSIRTRLETSSLHPEIRRHATRLFELLADAEAAVHGCAPDDVAFHEVGAWDSIADIIGAAALIHAIDAEGWTCSPAPMGSGRIKSAHGMLAVPAPATTLLLMGMQVLDDGISGERVTPTGAAILRYLCPPRAAAVTSQKTRILVGTGTGFGTRTLPGISNHIRVLCFETTPTPGVTHRTVHVVEFEVDDQSGEDLAMGLERLRAHPGVLDVTQAPVFGKKGRMMAHLQVLVREGHRDAVIEACFRETTTIGLRHHAVAGVGLKRRSVTHLGRDGERVRIKMAERPGGTTAKTEADDVLAHAGHANRMALRREAESQALSSLRQASAAVQEAPTAPRDAVDA